MSDQVSSSDLAKTSEISQEHKEYLRRVRMEKIWIRVIQFLLLTAAVLLWEVCANFKIVDPFITSQPSRVIKTIIALYKDGMLFHHIGITCLEAVIGFVLGTLIGTIIAIMLWWSEFLCKVIEPYLVVLNSLPKIALGPVFIVWIGAGPAAIIVMTLAISLIVTVLEVLNGFLTTDQEKIKLVRTFGGTKIQVLTKVLLPASYPTIINALKINVGLSWVGVIVGEFLVSKAGLGYLIVYGGQVFKLDLVMTSVIILGIAATVMYQGVVYLEKVLVKNKL
ncbi:ABC-type nitrate/sulfonate/bicarbonate transport system, permease component [Desulfosporosinus orientis DSM 765]|uniref:ABC-type nitrate/sulfonate/bicarbonate transport system, permease component n=1 Tax=Desulfosporosinus orientis (strain ATCC 19365 / DSM 765 / NCIMB 8382 / VKM B-1628 / Singapore I) TaxID=768706 RepID=G7WB80_DESOD|nr:ABC-type nitrate/sulfonate/bicarbonate transport system, permease component [Desulfosporosinus orientis DSM 765]